MKKINQLKSLDSSDDDSTEDSDFYTNENSCILVLKSKEFQEKRKKMLVLMITFLLGFGLFLYGLYLRSAMLLVFSLIIIIATLVIFVILYNNLLSNDLHFDLEQEKNEQIGILLVQKSTGL
ncbi:hypothetical protein M0812_20305 [Anaeramoeba flamelloides]|uniref:Uncharacterized protein n=1 Tax=Anaeramoeba flamelloides TaxID=1746091 RepID=A0AAV7YZW6_9EUKA|nr:hypothetical protein M0812_20305 [Anaeramoeba flamelloides]